MTAKRDNLVNLLTQLGPYKILWSIPQMREHPTSDDVKMETLHNPKKAAAILIRLAENLRCVNSLAVIVAELGLSDFCGLPHKKIVNPAVYEMLCKSMVRVGLGNVLRSFPKGCGDVGSYVMEPMEAAGLIIRRVEEEECWDDFKKALKSMGLGSFVNDELITQGVASKKETIEEKFEKLVLKDEDDTFKCKVCLEKVVSHMYTPCNHLCLCEICARSVKGCPICRSKGAIIKIFI